MAADAELDDLSDSSLAAEGDLGEIGRPGPALALDQRLDATADVTAQMAA
jgi:hypothetical protein